MGGRVIAAIALASSILAGGAIAQENIVIQFQCGAMSGHGYMAEEGLVSPGEGGWSEEKIEDGEMVIDVNYGTEEIRIRYKDTSQTWRDPTDEGGAISPLFWDLSDGSVMFAIAYPSAKTMEIYTVANAITGDTKLLYSSSRNGDIFTSHKTMIADCKSIRIE